MANVFSTASHVFNINFHSQSCVQHTLLGLMLDCENMVLTKTPKQSKSGCTFALRSKQSKRATWQNSHVFMGRGNKMTRSGEKLGKREQGKDHTSQSEQQESWLESWASCLCFIINSFTHWRKRTAEAALVNISSHYCPRLEILCIFVIVTLSVRLSHQLPFPQLSKRISFISSFLTQARPVLAAGTATGKKIPALPLSCWYHAEHGGRLRTPQGSDWTWWVKPTWRRREETSQLNCL